MDSRASQLSWSRLRVGLLFAFSLVLLFTTVMFAGNMRSLFRPRASLTALFEDVRGLRAGAPVFFGGVEVGTVGSLRFTPDRSLRVGMSIESDVARFLKADSRAVVMNQGLLGDKFVELTPGGAGSPPLQAGQPLRGELQTEIQDVVESSGESLAKIERLSSVLVDLIGEIESGKGTVGRLVRSTEIHDQLSETTTRLAELVRKVDAGTGSLGRLVNDDALYRDLSASSARIAALLERLERGEGLMGRLIDDRELSSQVTATVRDLDLLIRDIRENPKKYFKVSVF